MIIKNKEFKYSELSIKLTTKLIKLKRKNIEIFGLQFILFGHIINKSCIYFLFYFLFFVYHIINL